MNIEEFKEVATNQLANDIVRALRCQHKNSEGKFQPHDWSDTYRRWGWQKWRYRYVKWWPARMRYRMCLRCGYEARRLAA